MSGLNPNPRVGVLLAIHKPSQRTVNVLWRFRLKGIKWLAKHWPEERLRRELRGYGPKTSREWNSILAYRLPFSDGFRFGRSRRRQSALTP